MLGIIPRILMVLLPLCGLLFAGGPSVAFGKRPNVLFLLTDDQRPDTIHALGNSIIRTPNLDRLVARGLTFRRAVCANPICTPSRAEILSGCSGFSNGVIYFGRTIRPELTLWPQAMQSAGYRTYYVGKWHNDGRPTTRGYDATQGLFAGGGGKWWVDKVDWKGMNVTGYRGWVFQDDAGQKFPDRGLGLTPDISRSFADAAIDLIRKKDAEPFFLHVNFTAPHDPLLNPPGFEDAYPPDSIPVPPNFAGEHPFDHGNLRGRDELLLPFPRTEQAVRELTSVYYRVISHLDTQVGRIVAALQETGQLDNTIIVFASDHGLAIGSHGLRGKQNMYEHTINVPMIVAGPGIPSGVTTSAQAYLRDLYPTVCELCEIDIPESVEATSLVPVVKDPSAEVHPYVFCYFREQQRMIRRGPWKLIEYPEIGRFQLFNVERDPHEQHDHIDTAESATVKQELMTLLTEVKAKAESQRAGQR